MDTAPLSCSNALIYMNVGFGLSLCKPTCYTTTSTKSSRDTPRNQMSYETTINHILNRAQTHIIFSRLVLTKSSRRSYDLVTIYD